MRRRFAVLAILVLLPSCGEPTGDGRPVPSSLVVVSGSGQTDTIGAVLANPLTVRVVTATGGGVRDVTVRFQSTSNGSVAPDVAITDGAGVAVTHWTLRTASGPDTVRATASVLAGQQGLFTATVQPGRLAHLVLLPDTLRFFKLDDTTALQAQGTDRAQNPVVVPPLQWNTGSATVAVASQSGVIRSQGRGTTSASAQDPVTGVRDSVVVVVSQVPQSVVVTPAIDTLNWIGADTLLSGAAFDSAGFPITAVPFSWRSADPGVALVDTLGRVTAVATGSARIVLAFQGIEDTALVTVRQVPASVVVSPSLDTLDALADTLKPAAVVQDSGGVPIAGAVVTWSSSAPAVAEVISAGVVVSRANGSAAIEARLAGLADTVNVVVRQKAVRFDVQPQAATLAIGEQAQFTEVAYDRNGFSIDTSIVQVPGVWRSLNVNWLTVSATGTATARAAGSAGVLFRHDNAADTATVTVLPPALGPVTSWEWKNPLPQGNTLQSVWGNGNNDVYAVGNAGTIVHFNGATWQPEPRLGVTGLIDVWVSPTGQAFVAGSAFLNGRGMVVRGSVGSWTVDTVSTTGGGRAIWGASDTSVFAVTDGLKVLKFNGATWSEIGALAMDQPFDIEGVSSRLFWVSGAAQTGPTLEGVIVRHDSLGWSEVYRGFIGVMDLWVAEDSSAYALGRGPNCSSSVLHSNGASWDTLATFATDLLWIHGRSQSDIYAMGLCNGFQVNVHWDGINWTTEQAPAFDAPRQPWAPPGGTWVAVGGFGTIQTNTGAAWQPVTTGLRGNQYAVTGLDMWLASAADVYATSHDSRVLHWNGTALSEVVTPISGAPSPLGGGSQRPLNAVWGSSASDLYVGGGFTCLGGGGPTACDGVLMHFNGASWDIVYDPGIIIDAIWGTERDNVFALGNEAGWHFDGTTWSRTGQGVFEGDRIRAVWGAKANDVWACGASRELYRYDGTSWSPWGPFAITCGSLFGFAPNDIYMAGSSSGPNGGMNSIGHFDGVSWSVVYTGRPPTGFDNEGVVWGSGPNDVHVTFGDEYMRFDGSNWQSQPLPPMRPLTILGDSRGVIVGTGESAGLVLGHH